MYFDVYGAMTKWFRHWIPNPGIPISKLMGGSKVKSFIPPKSINEYQEFLGRQSFKVNCLLVVGL